MEVGVHKVLVLEVEVDKLVTTLTSQGTEKPAGSCEGTVTVVVGVHNLVTLTSHLGTTPEGKSNGKVRVVVGVQMVLVLVVVVLVLVGMIGR